MASLIPGYEYDIFISYRQKDNKGDKWVSEFVEALRDELESTFKEEISVYFDENPHDGLLETHDVDESLKDKLRCLIFIPILSRTYCDPNAFGWGHEFMEFVKNASQDQFGLKIKLPSGNVANRVLPVRIHDLDSTDIALYESTTGGVLRGIEFIYKSSGVNRPLRPKEDKPQENLNNTIYRDQINKMALAIKEIVQGLKTGPGIPVKEKDQQNEPVREIIKKEKKISSGKPVKYVNYKILTGLALLVILIAATLIAYPKIFKRRNTTDLKSADGRIAVAVMPFQNLTDDPKLNNWQRGIQDELVNNLTNTEELNIIPSESINGLLYSQGITSDNSVTSSVAGKIAAKLNANISVCGSINQSGSVLRINALLTDSKTGDAIKSFKKEGTLTNKEMLPIIDPLATEIKNFLIISGLKEDVYIDPQRMGSSDNPDAYRYFTYGQKAFAKRDFPEAIKMLTQAVAMDSNLTYAILHIGWAYYNQGIYDEAKKWCLKAYNRRNTMNLQQQTYTNFVHARFFETPYEAIKCLKQLQEMDDNWPHLHYDMGQNYLALFQYDNAVPELEKSLEMYREKGLKPWWVSNYTSLGRAYHRTGQFRKEQQLYKKAEKDFPDDPFLIQCQAILALSEGKTKDSEDYIEKYISVRKNSSATEASIASDLAYIYAEAEIPDKAEEYYSQSLSFEPENPARINTLAYFLINKERNIIEGLKLIDRALVLSPDNYEFLDTKGWGLFKQGKYQDALAILQKGWNLRRANATYNHQAYLHLEAARKGEEEKGR